MNPASSTTGLKGMIGKTMFGKPMKKKTKKVKKSVKQMPKAAF